MRIDRRLGWVIAALCLLAVIPAALDHPRYRACFGPAGWEAPQGFFANATPPEGDLPADMLHSPMVKVWRNCSDQGEIVPGLIRSAPFILQKRQLTVPMIGHPNSPAAGVVIETETDHRRFRLNAGASPSQAQPFTATLPRELVHQPVRLIAYANVPGVYLGVGTPFYQTSHRLHAVEFSKVFAATAAGIIYLLLLFGPGFFAARRLAGSAPDRLVQAMLLTCVVWLALYYVAFYWPAVGRAIAHMWLLVSLGLIAWSGISAARPVRLRPVASLCLALIISLTIFQACFVFSFNTLSAAYASNYLFSPATWSSDNQIPTVTAQLLANGSLLSGWGFGEWRPSDRTPLLACLLYPAAVILRDLGTWIDTASASTFLQIAAFGIINSWVLPVWIVMRRLRLSRSQIIAGVLLLAATPFMFFNTVYIWPKLLAATLCLSLCLYLAGALGAGRGRSRRWSVALCAAAGSLAIMSHSAAAVAVVSILVAACFARPINWRRILLAGALTAGVVLPWIIWTKYSAPTSQPLPKFLLTGEFGFSHPRESVLSATLRTYRSMDIKDWLTKKREALETVCGWNPGQLRGLIGQPTGVVPRLNSVRACQFLFLLPSLGLLLIPLVGRFFKTCHSDRSDGSLTISEARDVGRESEMFRLAQRDSSRKGFEIGARLRRLRLVCFRREPLLRLLTSPALSLPSRNGLS